MSRKSIAHKITKHECFLSSSMTTMTIIWILLSTLTISNLLFSLQGCLQFYKKKGGGGCGAGAEGEVRGGSN